MTAIGIGLLFLIGLLIGAWVALFIFKYTLIPPAGLPLFSGGFLTGLIAFTLLPHAFQDGGFGGVIFGLSLSLLLLIPLHSKIHKMAHSFTLPAIAIALHTIPLCMAIGAISDPQSGQALFLATILHHIPEAAALTLLAAGRNGSLERLLLFFIVLSAIAVISIQAGEALSLPPSWQSVLFGMSVGLLLYTLLSEVMMNEVKRNRGFGFGAAVTGLLAYGILVYLLKFIGLS